MQPLLAVLGDSATQAVTTVGGRRFDPDTDRGLPVWSPDGSTILFDAMSGKEHRGIYRKAFQWRGKRRASAAVRKLRHAGLADELVRRW
jgi:hypothetical protein